MKIIIGLGCFSLEEQFPSEPAPTNTIFLIIVKQRRVLALGTLGLAVKSRTAIREAACSKLVFCHL